MHNLHMHRLLAGASAAIIMIGQGLPMFRPDPIDHESRISRGSGRSKYWIHPHHNARRMTSTWGWYRNQVVKTHSDRPDPRHDKYLHAHARRRRAAELSA